MSKEEMVNKLLKENVDTSVKYHTVLPADVSPWYVYTKSTGHRILCVLKKDLAEGMTGDDYRDRLVSAPVKTVLRGYTVQDGFVVLDCDYDTRTGFITEQEDMEFDASAVNNRYTLKEGEPYLPGKTVWPEAVEYNYFSNNHELRFFLKNPTRYVTEVIRKMPLQLGLFVQDDIILMVYRFTDYKKKMIPVHGYSPFSIHMVPENLRTIPEAPADDEHEELIFIHLVDADTGILKAMRSVNLSPEFSAALCSAIIRQASVPLTDDYNERLKALDSGFPDTESLMDHCIARCNG
jgi:hypothetical protein